MSDILITALSIFVAFLGLSILVLVHELGHFTAAKTSKVGVKEFSIGFGKKIWGFKKGETEYQIAAIPLGGYVKLVGLDDEDQSERSYTSKSKLTRMKILAGGVVFNFLFAIIVFTLCNMHGMKQLKPTINVAKDMPASLVLKDGDEISKVNGVGVSTWLEFSEELSRSKGEPIKFVVLRNGQELEVVVKPVKMEAEDEFGGKIEKWVIGVGPTGDIIITPGLPAGKAFKKSAELSWKAYATTYKFIGKLFVKEAKAEKGLGGPVLIMTFLTGAVKDGFFSFFSFLAVVSLMLGIMNSLPIPILDGGHMMFLGVEAIRGKPLKKKTERVIQTVFFYLLILLMAFATYLDIGRLWP